MKKPYDLLSSDKEPIVFYDKSIVKVEDGEIIDAIYLKIN
jgi:hypothetical protein